MAHCTSCGLELPANARFCSQCGTAVGALQPGAMDKAEAGSPSGDGHMAGAAADPSTKIWMGGPSRKDYLPGLLLAVVMIVAGAVGTAAGLVPLIALAILGGLMSLWTLGQMLLAPLMLRYWLTSDRLFIRRGLLRITTDQLELVRVEDIRVRQGIWDRFCGIGDVEIIASSDATHGDSKLVGVNEPMRVAELIRAGMQTQRRRRGMFVENV